MHSVVIAHIERDRLMKITMEAQKHPPVGLTPLEYSSHSEHTISVVKPEVSKYLHGVFTWYGQLRVASISFAI